MHKLLPSGVPRVFQGYDVSGHIVHVEQLNLAIDTPATLRTLPPNSWLGKMPENNYKLLAQGGAQESLAVMQC